MFYSKIQMLINFIAKNRDVDFQRLCNIYKFQGKLFSV
jgi:hypothetical protein